MTLSNTDTDRDIDNSLKGRARNYIVDQIRRGILRPGQHVPSVRELSRSLDISTNVAFLAIKELRDEQLLERLANGRHQVVQDPTSVLRERVLRLGFASQGAQHIRQGVYQSIFNHLHQRTRSARFTVDCLLDLQDTWSTIEPGFYDALLIADWQPPNAAELCHGPCIGLDTREFEVDCVVKTDHFRGGELAGRHLRERGRKRVVYWDNVKEEAGVFQGLVYRRLGFSKGWIDAGGALDDIIHLPVVTSEKQDLVPLVKEYLGKADAFFVFWDTGALRMWQVLEQLYVKVPDDLALMGYDGSYDALKHDPPLTTIQQPCREIAEQVVSLLTEWNGEKDAFKDREILVAPSLLPGGST